MKFWEGYRNYNKHSFERLVCVCCGSSQETNGGEIQELTRSGNLVKMFREFNIH